MINSMPPCAPTFVHSFSPLRVSVSIARRGHGTDYYQLRNRPISVSVPAGVSSKRFSLTSSFANASAPLRHSSFVEQPRFNNNTSEIQIDIDQKSDCYPQPQRLVISSSFLTPTFLVFAGGIVSFALSAALGANDVANSLGTAVGTGAIGITSALCIGAVMEFSGAILFGSTVTKTISSGVVTIGATTLTSPLSYMLGMLAVLVGCTVWMAVATKFGLPVSSTHSVVGALIGLGLVSGWGVSYGALNRIVASWFLSPLIGGIVSFIIYRVLSLFLFNLKRPARTTRKLLPVLAGTVSFMLSLSLLAKSVRFSQLTPDKAVYLAMAISLACSGVAGALATVLNSEQNNITTATISQALEEVGVSRAKDTGNGGQSARGRVSEEREEVESIFKILQILSACLLAFSHGSNDVSNAIGPFAAMYSMWASGGQIGGTVMIPIWLLVLGGLGISTGLALFGKPVMETVGTKITKLKPMMGFCVELSTALTVLIASQMGLPVSTTHTLIGCIVALGISRGSLSGVNKNVIFSIAGSWGVTLPFSALVTVLFYAALRPFIPVVPALL